MTVEELLINKNLYYQVSGNDFLVHCLNPEHEDNNPSMRIDKILGIFNCLSCGFKGNIFSYYGENYNPISIKKEKLYRKIEKIRTESIGLKLPINMSYIDYNFRVSVDTLKEFEAFTSANKDYEGRIMFPIRDLKEKICCFIGRLENDYKEDPKYKIYPNKSIVPLYPLHKIIPEQGRIILVEGLFDLLNLWDQGFRNVIVNFGTQGILDKNNINLLKLLGINGVDIIFDSDEAGKEGATKLKTLLESEYLNARIITLKNGIDPGNLSSTQATRLKERIYG